MAVITFKHSCDNDKVEKLIDKYGTDGYYVLFRTIEMFASNKNNPIILDTQKDFDILMHYLKGVKYERAKEIYDYIQETMEMFNAEIYKRGILQIGNLQTRKEPRNINDAIKGKKHVAEFVYLTQNQIDELVQKYGKEFTMRCVETLNDYKANHGGVSRYNDDAAAIRNWVVDKTMKEYRFQNYKYPFMNDIQSDAPAQPKFKPRT